jgi:hypothetical protein
MRVPRVRFTVRGLMLITVVVAVATWQAIAWIRQPRYRRLAEVYAAKEMVSRNPSFITRADSILIADRDGKVIYQTMQGDGTFTCKSANRDYYAKMAHKYKWAARFPFLPVAPDPPEPE